MAPRHKPAWNLPLIRQDEEFYRAQVAAYNAEPEAVKPTLTRERFLATPKARIDYVLPPGYEKPCKDMRRRQAEEEEARRATEDQVLLARPPNPEAKNEEELDELVLRSTAREKRDTRAKQMARSGGALDRVGVRTLPAPDEVALTIDEASSEEDDEYEGAAAVAPGQRKLELFGRPHNIHKGWTTLGNQLGKSQITEPWLRQRLLDEGIFVEDDMTALPPPPADPIVPPWGGHSPPPPLADLVDND